MPLILFDMGNTLLDYHAGPRTDEELDHEGLRAMSERLATWGHSVTPQTLKTKFYDPWIKAFEKRKSQLQEFDVTEFLSQAFPAKDLSQNQLKTLLLDFHEPSAKAAIADEGTKAALAYLKSQGLKLGMISNTALPGYCHDRTLELQGLVGHLDIRLYSYEERIRKPHPELFKRALQATSETPETTVMIGDSPELDLEPAVRLGIRVLQYDSPRNKKPKSFEHSLNLGKVSTIPEAATHAQKALKP